MVINQPVSPGASFILEVEQEHVGKRLDVYLSQVFVSYSRSFLKRLIDAGNVVVHDQPCKAGYIVRAQDRVVVTFVCLPERRIIKPLDTHMGIVLVAQEPDFLVVFKPAGVMVHKPNDHATDNTLVDWLVASYDEIKQVGTQDRPGIVHRLDKNTSGLLIVPRTPQAHALFGEMFRLRKITKLYWAVVDGHPDKEGMIDLPIGRDPVHKHRMAHVSGSIRARDALTSYRVLEYYADYSLVQVHLVTGRTHQIRVHFAAIRHPVLGDSVYGESSPLIARQALHAKTLSFVYQGVRYEYNYSVPPDMASLIEVPTI